MASKREQIIAAVVTTLNGTVGIGSRVYRNRVEPMARDEEAAIIVTPRKDIPTQNTSLPTLEWTFLLDIVVIKRALIADQAADPTIVSMHSKLLSDLTLGGLAIDVQPAPVTFEFVEADTPAGVFTCAYQIRYRTSVVSLET